MKKYFILPIVALLTFAFVMPASAAVDYTGVYGLGLGIHGWAPMMKGSDLDREPYAMGLGGGLNFKYGFTDGFVLNAGVGYAMTYDDTTTTDDATFKFFSKDNSSVKLTGILTEVTAQYYFMPESNIRPYVLGGLGANLWTVELSQADDSQSESLVDLVIKGGAGVAFALGENADIDFGIKLNFLPAYISKPDSLFGGEFNDESSARAFQAYLEPRLSFNYYFGGGKDTDKDGVKDEFDQCPDTPLGAMVDANGCPLDEDNDGVYDGLDQCPNTPRGARVDVNGCPMDSDKDGIFDGIDKCPNTPSGISVDSKGCPMDEDDDGVPDYKDKCPGTPSGATVDATGCPMDRDNDGVYDGIDRCDGTPAGIEVDNYGCPTAKPIKDTEILRIEYARGSVEPDEGGKKYLNDLAQRLMAYPDVKIEIAGYTDALGSRSGNERLSQKRADAVKTYLVGQGISDDRLVAKGYGETNFIDGIDKNSAEQRRIEIKPMK
ncbi:MAG: OmpA family protein [candidate division Zixibacteria bacterium]|nr:OmpA family protein [candidate division Zixibacteria bacterium]